MTKLYSALTLVIVLFVQGALAAPGGTPADLWQDDTDPVRESGGGGLFDATERALESVPGLPIIGNLLSIYADGGWATNTLDGSVRVNRKNNKGTELDFKDNLGIESGDGIRAGVITEVFFLRLGLAYEDLNFEGTKSNTTTFKFKGRTFAATTAIDTTITGRHYTADAGLKLSLPIPFIKYFGVGLSIQALDLEVEVTGRENVTNNSITMSESFLAPLVMGSAFVGFELLGVAIDPVLNLTVFPDLEDVKTFVMNPSVMVRYDILPVLSVGVRGGAFLSSVDAGTKQIEGHLGLDSWQVSLVIGLSI